jgi:outer membrane protein assembly factor BamB
MGDIELNTTISEGSQSQQSASAAPRSLRLWPAVAIAVALGVVIAVPRIVAPSTPLFFYSAFLGPMAAALLYVIWWLFASRVPWLDKLIGFLLIVGAAAGTVSLAHPTVMAILLSFALPTFIGATTLWFLVTRRVSWNARRWGGFLVAAASLGGWTLIRSGGIYGDSSFDFSWRWTATAEDRYLASLATRGIAPSQPEPGESSPANVDATPEDWPEFRGPRRDGHVRGVILDTDWEANPPKEIWRRPIGPGWSSFARVGDRVYTQEQRGESETVLCLDAASGTEIWSHQDKTRFMEAMAGPGPRATPTYHGGKIFALGANGTLNCLDAESGSKIWSTDIGRDRSNDVPMWGFASSPLVVDGTVLVYSGGGEGKGVIAYDSATGKKHWSSGGGTHSYSSPQIVRIAGVDQVLMLTDQGLDSIEPKSGRLFWSHAWPIEGMYRVVQPNTAGDQVLMGTGMSRGTRLLDVRLDESKWKVSEIWTSIRLKPYYNDFVVHEGHLYGFDGNIFACVELEGGERAWKGGRYGSGQVLLLEDQGLLLVLSERGELVLVEADPSGHKELSKFKAIEGKTWNHPVISRGRVYVRNGQEAACFALKQKSADKVAGVVNAGSVTP